jgi:hypothetical protein
MKNITIFIDESGTLPDPQDQVVIIAAVGTKLPEKLRGITNSARKILFKKDVPEIKFYKSGEKTKKFYLEKLNREDIEIFVLTIEKQGLKIIDSPENFALLCWLVLEDCLLFYQDAIKEVVFDRHFHKTEDQEIFNHLLTQLLNQKLKIIHTDSQNDTRVNTADMIAGSLLWLKTGKEKTFYELFKGKIISEKVVSWKNLRKKFFETKKSR